MEKAILSNSETSCCSVSRKQKTQSEKDSKYIPFVSKTKDGHQIDLHIEGIHCAKCIWAIESLFQKEPDIIKARVNMSTSRLHISWRGPLSHIDFFVSKINALGYKTSTLSENFNNKDEESSKLLRCMAIAGFAMGNIMLISVALWSSHQSVMGIATRELLHWISALIALPTIIYSGRPFFNSAISALKSRHTNMDVPISLALILASGMSLFETIMGGEHAYFDSAIMLLFFLLIGRWLDAKAKGKAREHASELLALLQGTATVIKGNKKKRISISELKIGDTILIALGERVPSDAKIVKGVSEIDTSLITGETIPKHVSKGDTVYGGTINLSAPLTCIILQPSKDSLLADVIRLMEQAEKGRAKYMRLADKAAKLYTPIVHTLALVAFIFWISFRGLPWQDALLIAITTLIITCPCALGLAVPAVQVLAVDWLMKLGVLVKNGDALERLNNITTVIFDKTGTLTKGYPVLQTSIESAKYKQIMASLADFSQHPLSKAISSTFDNDRLKVEQLTEIPGQGVKGVIDGKTYFLGKGKIDTPQDHSIVILEEDRNKVAQLSFYDPIRDDSLETIQAFKSNGFETVLLSGDHQSIVKEIGFTLGVNKVKANMLPDQKLQYVKALQQQGKSCLMVGDGLNDAPALAQADISISPSTGIDITQNTADMVFRGQSLKTVFYSWKMAKHSTKLIKQNFMLAVLYNICAIPLAVMGYVTPLIAAIAMSSSSLLVVGNSFRTRLLDRN